MPSFINFFGPNGPNLTGGQRQSLLNANFTSGMIVGSDGMASNTYDTGLTAGFDFIGSGLCDAGRGLGSAIASIISS